MISFIALLFHFWLLQAGATAAQESTPLPDLETFLQGIRNNLHSDQMLLNQYTYTEKTTLRQVDKKGNAKEPGIREYEVYPSLEPGATYRRLVSKDGKPLSAEETAKQDRDYEKKRAEIQRKLERESAADRNERKVKDEKEKQKEKETVDEAFRLYDIRIIGREVIDERPVITLAFDPRPGFKVKTEDGKILAKVRGRAWFSEKDHELMRLDVELIDSISIGLGLLAKVKPGTRMLFERRRLNNEIYLPARQRILLSGKLLVFKGFNIEVETTYSDYKKFSVETSVQYGDANKK